MLGRCGVRGACQQMVGMLEQVETSGKSEGLGEGPGVPTGRRFELPGREFCGVSSLLLAL